MMCYDWLKNHSLCVCSAHQNVVLLFDATNWNWTMQRPDQEDRLQP